MIENPCDDGEFGGESPCKDLQLPISVSAPTVESSVQYVAKHKNYFLELIVVLGCNAARGVPPSFIISFDDARVLHTLSESVFEIETNGQNGEKDLIQPMLLRLAFLHTLISEL
jgi:hypothetical protein